MSKAINLVIENGPSGKCPVQAEGTINGHEFYFRSRGGHWSLRVSRNGERIFDEANWFHVEPYRGRHYARDLEINDGREYSAGWADEDECMEFIRKAAAKFVGETTT